MTKFEMVMAFFMIVQISFTFGILHILNQYKKGKFSILIEDVSTSEDKE